jgi:hypothetical protein
MRTILYNKESGVIQENLEGEFVLTGLLSGMATKLSSTSNGAETNISEIPDLLKPSKLVSSEQIPAEVRDMFMEALTIDELKFVIDKVLFGDN